MIVLLMLLRFFSAVDGLRRRGSLLQNIIRRSPPNTSCPRPNFETPGAQGKQLENSGQESQHPSRLLKNNSPSTATCVTKEHAGNGRAAESGIQLLIAGGTGAEGSSAARHPGHGGR